MENSILKCSDDNFEDNVLKSEFPVLVDFWAEWCGPCRTIAPVIEELADEYKEKLKVGKLNIDENPKTPTQYGIRSIPTLLLFKGGKVLQQIVGVKPKADLKEMIDRNI